jgi:hypothetical protein
MTALAGDFDAPCIEGKFRCEPVAAGAVIYAGALVVMNSATGFAQPGSTELGLTALGRAEFQANNSGGANGAINVRIRRGVFLWNNSPAGADLIATANIGGSCYIVDDNTVALTSATSTRSVAGRIYDIDSQTGNVWVEVV